MSYSYKTSLEKKIAKIGHSVDLFVDTQRVAGVALIYCIAITLILANLPTVSEYYKELINLQFTLKVNTLSKTFTLTEFVNEFLLIFFFFTLGLEIKREFVVGELADLKKATLVVLGASGGVIVPILLYFLFNHSSHEFNHGWAIPIATDTAIAIGIMSLFKNKLPKAAFPFMVAMAVLDDIFAISIIAFFYTNSIQFYFVMMSILVILFLILANVAGIRSPLFYILLGFLLWYMFELAGIHAVIAGVIVAFTIPARPKDKPHLFVSKIKVLLNRFEKKHDSSQHILESDEQHDLLEQVTKESINATTPLKRWEDKLELPVLLFVLPLFALTNGAVIVNSDTFITALNTTLFWGILTGLFCGKPLGILIAIFFSLKLKLGKLPADMQYKDILPVGLLAGIGYTMAIFVSELAFENENFINIAKFSILISSFLAAVLAAFIIKKTR